MQLAKHNQYADKSQQKHLVAMSSVIHIACLNVSMKYLSTFKALKDLKGHVCVCTRWGHSITRTERNSYFAKNKI
jgi:hypothetical protein